MKKEYLNEIWKPIKGYEGLYEVSNFGRIKSLKRLVKSHNKWGECYIIINEKILKTSDNKLGYLFVKLYKNNKTKTYYIHRLVAEHFIHNPNNLPEVNHKDECKSNNIYTNLEWCDRKYNVNQGNRLKKISKKLKNKKEWSKPVIQYTLDGQFVKEWESINEADRNGYNHGHIAACCRGERKTHKGFIWEYKKI